MYNACDLNDIPEQLCARSLVKILEVSGWKGARGRTSSFGGV